jgi:hypothetical protein
MSVNININSCLRMEITKDEINIMVIGGNDEDGVLDEIKNMEKLEKKLNLNDISHSSQRRKVGLERKIDAVRFKIGERSVLEQNQEKGVPFYPG